MAVHVPVWVRATPGRFAASPRGRRREHSCRTSRQPARRGHATKALDRTGAGVLLVLVFRLFRLEQRGEKLRTNGTSVGLPKSHENSRVKPAPTGTSARNFESGRKATRQVRTSAACSTNHRYVSARPSSIPIRARHPRACARPTSNNFLGVPSGLVGSVAISPS